MSADGRSVVSRRSFLATGLAALALPSSAMDALACPDWQGPRTLGPLRPTIRIALPDLDDLMPAGRRFRAGVRPVRELAGGPPGSSGVRISRETIGAGSSRKHIIHNYGHGGAGITLSFGSARQAFDLIDLSVREVLAAGSRPSIIVLGSGIIGLTTAKQIVEGWKREWPRLNLTVRAVAFRDTTSFIAGGQFEPSVIFGTYERAGRLPELHRLLNDSHRRICALGPDGRRAYGITRRRNFSLVRDIPGYRSAYMPRTIVAEPLRWQRFPFVGLEAFSGYEYETWLINPATMMPALRSELEDQGVQFSIGTRHAVARGAIPSLSQNIIVNCTGIGSAQIFPDAGLRGVRGHLVYLRNRDSLRYLLSAGCNVQRGDMTEWRGAYLFARNDAIVVGGSWSPYLGGDPIAVDEAECRLILDRMKQIAASGTRCTAPGPR
jgi:glycine/D-amino acid oxidase-like deaminating enzyme